MITRIQAVHFDASQQLQEFVEKKVAKLEKLCEGASSLEVTMKLIKPETSMNKEVSLSLTGAGSDMFVSKVADKFEDALLECIDALKAKIERNKEKMRLDSSLIFVLYTFFKCICDIYRAAGKH